jgi:hypothetical protein
MSSITIGGNPTLTNLNKKVDYNPQSNYPAVTVFNNGNNNYSVFAICYVPTGSLITKTVQEFNDGDYSGFTPTETIPLVGNNDAATVVLSYFEDIKNADLVQAPTTQFTTRAFALCYDFDPSGASSYECEVYSLEFNYTVEDGSSYEVVFMAQGDLDPELSRGTVTSPAKPPH